MKRILALIMTVMMLMGAAYAENAAVTATEVPELVPVITVDATEQPEVGDADREELPLKGVIIGLDPGHQLHANKEKEAVAPGSSEMKKKVSSGTQGVITKVPEYVVNLDVALQLRDALEALGCEVVMSRTTHDVNISNQERAKMMNEANVDLWLRIHCDGSENTSKQGLRMFVVESGATAKESYRAGECLAEAMSESTGAQNRGVVSNDTYTGNNWSERPCVLVEMGFMSNANEDALLNSPDYQEKLVIGMVNGIRAFVGK